MIRVVAIRKALIAGASGALAWEAVERGLIALGLPLVDLVRTLGTLAAPGQPVWLWWPAGLAIHLAVGAIGAIFYAYFVWARLPWRPVFQGLLFGLVAAVPMIVAVYPLLLVMHASTDVAHMSLMSYADMLGGRERLGLVIGHLIYGAVLGALYTRPVGRSTKSLPDLGPDIHRRPRGPAAPTAARQRLHVRQRDRVQLSDARERRLAPRPDGGDRSLPELARGPGPDGRNGRDASALRTTLASDLYRTWQVRLVVYGPGHARVPATQSDADHRPLPLRSS